MSNKEMVMILFDKITEIQNLGNYASLQLANYGSGVSISAMKGEFAVDKDYELYIRFDFGENTQFNKAIEEMDHFIDSFKEKEMTIKELESVLGYKVKIVSER